ncbi:MAG: hypothetical protein RLZZ628_3447 [Bacteroidota bacterium]|jgi:tetratricopeptide (TPR) repeat protein
MSTRPVLLLTFAANDLKNVGMEAAQLREIAAQQPELDCHCVEALTVDKLKNAVVECGERLLMYHFSGHASPHALALTESQFLDSVRFARTLIPERKRLAFVFLNGCKSYGHLSVLTAKGVKAFIVTNTSIGDTMAMQLSAAFYELFLCKDVPLKSAFELAAAATNTGYKPNVLLVNPGEPESAPLSHAQWVLVIHADYPEVVNWRLADFVNPPKNNKIPRLLTQNAGNPSYFLGREADLAAISTAFSDSLQPLFLVNGEGGIGKTTLAARYWHLKQSTYNHLGWLNAASGIEAALLSLMLTFGIRFEPQDTTAMQIQKIVQQLNDLEHPVLLVFDNADDSADLEAHFMVLQQLTNCHILITTRVHELADARVHQVKPLSETEALTLFAHHYKALIDNELALLKNIFEAVGYNTLVIELLAKNLKVLNRSQSNAYPIARLLEDLQTKGLLAILTKEVQVTYKSQSLRKAKPEEIIRAMYDLHPLSAASVYLLSNFAVLPSIAIPFETFCDLLKPTDVDAFEANLADLRQKGWIRFDESEDGYKVSSVVQAVVHDKNKEQLREDCDTLIKTLQNKLKRDTLHEENYKRSTAFTHYAESIVGSFPKPNMDIIILCDQIGTYHEVLGNLNKALKFYKDCKRFQEELYALDASNINFIIGLANSHCKLGNIYTELGYLEKALKFYKLYNQVEEELYIIYPSSVGFKYELAISYSKLGQTYVNLGDLEKALKFFEDYNVLIKELYTLDSSNVKFKKELLISYSLLGEEYTKLEKLNKSLAFYEDSNILAKELYISYPDNIDFKERLAVSYSQIGSTHFILGHLKKALAFYELSNGLKAELCANYPANVSFKDSLAISYSQLGDMHTSLGSLDKALKFYESSNRLEEELCASYPSNIFFKQNLAISYSKLGEIHAEIGDLERALSFHKTYNHLCEDLHMLYPLNINIKNNLATSHYRLGETYASLREFGKAFKFYETFNRLCGELYRQASSNVSFKRNLAISYSKLGVICTNLGSLDEALPHMKIAYHMFVDLYESTPTPLHYEYLKRTEMMLQMQTGCRSFLLKPLLWFLKLPFMNETVKKIEEQHTKELRENYPNLQK